MAFNGTEGAPIPLAQAGAWTANYRALHTVPGEVIANFFGRDILTQILAQDGTMGIRFYFAINNENKATIVAVGADANENDQINGIVADFTFPCPPHCGTSNILNSPTPTNS